MKKAKPRLTPQATWSGKPHPLHKDARPVVPPEARRTVKLLLGWYFEAREAERTPWRTTHYKHGLETIQAAALTLSDALKIAPQSLLDHLEANDDAEFNVRRFALELHKLTVAAEFPVIERESRGRPKKRAFAALVNGLDRVWFGTQARQDNRSDGRRLRRTKEHRTFIEKILDAHEIEYDVLPERKAVPALPPHVVQMAQRALIHIKAERDRNRRNR